MIVLEGLGAEKEKEFLPKTWLGMYSGIDLIIGLLLFGLHLRDSRRTKLTIFFCGT